MKSIFKKKGEDEELKSSKALIMSIFKDEDAKKAIRASVSAAEVIDVVSPARDTVNQALSVPYVAPKRQKAAIISLGQHDVAVEDTIQSVNNRISRTELEPHANMPCMGRDALVLSDTGRVMEVYLFTPDYNAMKVRLVDAALKYDCPHTDKTHILLVRNTFHVTSMDHNLIPPFVLRETGIRRRAKNTFGFMESIFILFHIQTINRGSKHLQECVHTYSQQMEPTCQTICQLFLDDEGKASSMMIISAEVRYMDALEMDDVTINIHPEYQMVPHDANKVASILGKMLPLCNSQAMNQLLKERGEIN
eukprot:5795935-Ditylum_brightwellii.AAC.2